MRRSKDDPRRRLRIDPGVISDDVLIELVRRVGQIEAGYREIAQKMGQLYMYADRHELSSLTRTLDRPMRNASDNERAMALILGELQQQTTRRQPGHP